MDSTKYYLLNIFFYDKTIIYIFLSIFLNYNYKKYHNTKYIFNSFCCQNLQSTVPLPKLPNPPESYGSIK